MKIEQYDINGNKIKIPIVESYKDCMTLIKSDQYRLSGKIESSFSIFFKNLVQRPLKPFGSSVLV